MNNNRKWIKTVAGKMMLVYISAATVIVATLVLSAMVIHNTALEVVLSLMSLAVFVVISLVFGKNITKQIRNAEQRLQDIAEGNVRHIKSKLPDNTELEELYNMAEDTVATLNDIISELNNGLDELAAGNLSHKLPENWNGDYALISKKYNEITISLRQTLLHRRALPGLHSRTGGFHRAAHRSDKHYLRACKQHRLRRWQDNAGCYRHRRQDKRMRQRNGSYAFRNGRHQQELC